jgi:aldose sugar dehydrogenase
MIKSQGILWQGYELFTLDLIPLLRITAISAFIVTMSSTGCFISAKAEPIINDPDLEVETVFSGLEFPTGLAFLGPDDILVLEKDDGTVNRIVNGNMLDEPILDVNIANQVERGLLGIAIGRPEKNEGHTYVYLYYTEAEGRDNGEILGNRLYRYELINDKLENPKLLLNLAFLPGPAHNGGVVETGPDGNVYLITGNLFTPDINEDDERNETQAENIPDGNEVDGRSGILRVTPQGQVVDGKGILGDKHPLDKYYAYGIRNSFGLTFDPVTGFLWDTENGGLDEINLVEPGFNSGWDVITGRAYLDNEDFSTSELVDFNGRGKYSDPEFSWYGDSIGDVGPTGIVFLHSPKLGQKYENDLFVGSWHNGEIYRFDLNDNRTVLDLQGELSDKKADTIEETESVLFGQDFGGTVDLEVGQDGYLYILSARDGAIYRIVPKSDVGTLTG